MESCSERYALHPLFSAAIEGNRISNIDQGISNVEIKGKSLQVQRRSLDLYCNNGF